ncbi:hypothetical protein [Pseudoalteromonas sp. T1lg48]|uniref:hypothetical protein n=1 Tax=Pseudoalteromonas sp. T1lg48 TaxID=2077100 RepID=UPI000CF5FE23|nr:hypothetical protein [Pseudoalteromonas sp. T1lg48]
MSRWILLLIALLCSTQGTAKEYPHREKPTDTPLFETVTKMQTAILAIESRNGIIGDHRAVIGESGKVLLDICANTDPEHIEYGCSTLSTLSVDWEYGLPKYGQHNIYYKPDLIIDDYKILEAVIIDSKVHSLHFLDTATFRMFLISSHKELKDFINNKTTLSDLKRDADPLGNDVIYPDKSKKSQEPPEQN